MHEHLLDRRADYPILARRTYLISNSLGAMHRGTRDQLTRYADEWETAGVLAWPDWIVELARVSDLLAEILGAPAGSVVLRASVADLLPTVASCLDFAGPRNRIVYSDLEWPGSHYFWTEQRRYGAVPVAVPISDDGVNVDIERLVAAIDARTLLVPISHVLFRSSTVMDIAPVVARAREVGALVLLDAYQSAGSMPIDVTALGVDFCVGGSVKYLSGGPGVGWMYANPELADTLRPAAVGWFGHAETFRFDFAPVRYAPGIRRFTGGTPNVPAVYAAEPGYRGVLDAGVASIRERSMALTQQLVEDALGRGFDVRSPLDPAQRGGHVTIDPGHGQEVLDLLHERGFVLDYRPGAGLRIAPHFYNTAEECDAVVAEIARIRQEIG